MKQTFYELLNVAVDADLKTIKRAFRTVSLKNHPDKAKDEADREFREVIYPRYVLANDVLTNEKKKRSYDHLLEIGRAPEKISDNAIETAWDEERGIWADEADWAPLEDWHSLLIILLASGGIFAVPLYWRTQAEKEKQLKAAKLMSEGLARLQEVAKKGTENFKSDASLQKALSEKRDAVFKPVEKKTKTKPTEVAAAKPAPAADPAAQAKNEKLRLRTNKFRAALRVLVRSVAYAQRCHAPQLLAQVKKDVKAAGDVVPGALKVSVAVYATKLGDKEADMLAEALPLPKLESLVATLCSNMGVALAPTVDETAAADSEDKAVVTKYGKALEVGKLRQALVSVFIVLAQLAPNAYPDPVALAK